MSKQQIKILNFVKGKSHDVDHYVKDAFVINAECIECTKELISISYKSKRHALKDLFKHNWTMWEDEEGYWFLCGSCSDL